MNEIYSHDLVIGVDAGGTRSRACLAAPDGTVLGRGTGGPGNALSVPRAELTLHLAQAVAGAVPEALRDRVRAVYGGFAGATAGLGPERGRGLALSCLRDAVAAHGITGAVVDVGGDIDVALAAAPGAPADGLVLIAGTGAIAARLTGRRRSRVVDGHGWLLGDEGSGYWLGAHAVRAALEALDGRGPWTSLVTAVAAHHLPEAGEEAARSGGRTVPPDAAGRFALAEAIVAHAYARPPAQLARLSTAVVACAAAGDTVALHLLDRAADLLAGTVAALRPEPGEPLVVTGGLLGPGGPLLDRVTDRLGRHRLRIFPVTDGAAGAAALAAQLPVGTD
ncbi:N-acetylglucosamine kinase [Actinacidiphila acididurans]|uniref:ATPase n=1 Tax=Actinacidiphila acididurans TaxID=2784346 RepID=A0ABS2TTL2_9ACTN|nr:BadF/BadG/BcrA/BcrD ATPase family protein [Actinacidiphila acididurans]MBM9505610.1 ATPase [Actinacidiphila acididurans]